ncbi:MAG: GNAT family N-acetyltransferase [Thermoplasmata archaeon]|jgi:GNAT superfamily N-acetyltransferase
MKLVTYDELPASLDSGRALVHLAAFGGVADRRGIEIWRRRTSAFAEYVGIFAVDKGEVVGQTLVLRIPFTFPHGTETVSGIAAVSTRLDYARAGIARRILDEVHRRERESGVRYSTLWTNRSWGAHRLYEKLGYRDVYEPPLAVRVPDVVPHRPAGRRIRPGRRSDLRQIETLHARFAEGRWGFAIRPQGFARVAAAAGELRPREEILVSTEGGRLSGYAMVDTTPHRVVCGELVALAASERSFLASSIETRAGRVPTAFRDGVVAEIDPWLRRRGYALASAGWFGLMAHELGRERTRSTVVREMGTQNPRFLCLTGDRF